MHIDVESQPGSRMAFLHGSQNFAHVAWQARDSEQSRLLVQQCIDFLVNRVGHEKANAEGEVRRSFAGNYSPLYQLAYMIGGLQFRALKNELVDTHKMTYRQYHDAILHENSIPIEMLRAILTNQPLTRDFTSNWKFYK